MKRPGIRLWASAPLLAAAERLFSRLACTGLSLLLCMLPFSPAHALTIGEEREIGEKLLYTVRAQFDLIDDPDISAYINDLGTEVLNEVGAANFKYHFFIVKSDQFNAFAAPAGLVFFYTGLIGKMHNEDELVSVLAHEIGHVVSRHIASRLDKSGKISAATLALGLAGLALGVPALSQALLAGSMAAGTAISLQYSRLDEEQADRLSYDWMRKMGRDPEAMVGMLGTMRRITRYSMNELPQYLLTHPNPEARLDYVQSLLELNRGQQGRQFSATDNFAFLRFQYRIMARSADPEQMRILCSTRITSAKSAEEEVMGHYGMALLDADEHNPDSALTHFAIVEEHYADRDILAVDKAVLLRKANRLDEATALLKQAIHRNPASMYAAYEMGKTLEMQGRFQEAEPLFLKVARDMPDFSSVYYELGRIQASLGRESRSGFYLAKYYLYEGKIKAAKRSLQAAAKDDALPQDMRDEAAALLARLEELEKNS